MMSRLSLGFAIFASLLLAASPAALPAQQSSPPSRPTSVPSIPASDLLKPKDLVLMLQATERPLVLQVGSHVLYAEAHIANSEYVEAAGNSSGLEALRKRVTGLRKDQIIVVYCGCCPWGRCPNVRPAYDQLRALGFTRVKALYIAENFGKDWVEKGYPVEKGR